MKSWMVIAAVGLVVALAANLITPSDVKWFKRLQRPRWLTFEPLIPFIWTVVFILGGWSAYIVWERTQSWPLMGFYLLLEIAIIAYTPVMFRTRNLTVGTVIGAIGFLIGLVLALVVLGISQWAALLLLPFLLWSPIGTYTTWEMKKLNDDQLWID